MEVVMRSTLLALILSLAGVVHLAAQDTLRYTPTVGYPTFDVREPVATITPGTVLISRTNHGAYYDEGGGCCPGEVCPFWVEVAEVGERL